MRRARVFVSIALGALVLGAGAGASRSTLEIFGVGAGDAIEVDAHPIVVKTGVSKAYAGQPLPGDAPAITELAPGPHEVTLHRDGCATRTFSVEVQGAYHRTIVVAPKVTARCAIPKMPPRVQ